MNLRFFWNGIKATDGRLQRPTWNSADRAAYQSLCFAISKLSASGPNERDYYPQGHERFEQARIEHCSRLERLLSVRKELEVLAEAIDTGGAK